MTPEETERRFGPEPDELAQARHDREDREADHTPAADDLRSRRRETSPSPGPTDVPSRGRTAISPADSALADRLDGGQQ